MESIKVEFFTEEDNKKAQELSAECSPTKGSNGECFVAAKRMAIHKNEELQRHEQSILWTFQSIIDKLVYDAESYDTAMKEFKEHLIFDFD